MTRRKPARPPAPAPDTPAPDAPDTPPAPDTPAPAAGRYRALVTIDVSGDRIAAGDVVDGSRLPHLDTHLAFGEVEVE